MVRKLRGSDTMKFKSLKDFIDVYNKYVSVLNEYKEDDDRLIAFNLELESMNKCETTSLKGIDSIFRTFAKTYETDMGQVSYVDLVQKYKIDVTKTFAYSSFIKARLRIKDYKVDIKVESTERVKKVCGVPVNVLSPEEASKLLPPVSKKKQEVKKVDVNKNIAVDSFKSFNDDRFEVTIGDILNIHDDYEVMKYAGGDIGDILNSLIEKFKIQKSEFAQNNLLIRISSLKELFGIPEGYIINGSVYFAKMFGIYKSLDKPFIKSFIESKKISQVLKDKAKKQVYIPVMNVIGSDVEIIPVPKSKQREVEVDKPKEDVVQLTQRDWSEPTNSTKEIVTPVLTKEKEVTEDDVILDKVSNEGFGVKINKLISIQDKMESALKTLGYNSLDELETFIKDYKKASKKLDAIMLILED